MPDTSLAPGVGLDVPFLGNVFSDLYEVIVKVFMHF